MFGGKRQFLVKRSHLKYIYKITQLYKRKSKNSKRLFWLWATVEAQKKKKKKQKCFSGHLIKKKKEEEEALTHWERFRFVEPPQKSRDASTAV